MYLIYHVSMKKGATSYKQAWRQCVTISTMVDDLTSAFLHDSNGFLWYLKKPALCLEDGDIHIVRTPQHSVTLVEEQDVGKTVSVSIEEILLCFRAKVCVSFAGISE